ncbi:hypothetical protein ABZ929_29450 [Streptomyces physcomitrii]|uniref:hypothetical protein n=1 Tax=Streptomyces physcomitrii TaxID=2724184 RepID=UPI0034483035
MSGFNGSPSDKQRSDTQQNKEKAEDEQHPHTAHREPDGDRAPRTEDDVITEDSEGAAEGEGMEP